MVHRENFVAVVQTADGATLREFPTGDRSFEVRLPFGSEYRLYFRNLDTRKAMVSVEIDGKDVLGGNRILVGPKETSTLEGFIDGSKVAGKFRFIQKTKEIAEHRGDSPIDGIIRIEVAFEKEVRTVITEEHRRIVTYPRDFWWPYPYIWPRRVVYYGQDVETGILKSHTNSNQAFYTSSLYNSSDTVVGSSIDSETVCSRGTVINNVQQPLPDEGITVMGGSSKQRFSHASIGETDKPFVITFRLFGLEKSETKAEEPKPVITRKDLECPTCGRKNPSNNRFCGNCSTGLVAGVNC